MSEWDWLDEPQAHALVKGLAAAVIIAGVVTVAALFWWLL